MKIKLQPDDFFVREMTNVKPGAQGEFGFYRLEKRGWTTPDAVEIIRKRLKIGHGRISYGGLKDRHAHTIQYLTIFHGPARQLTHNGIVLNYLGRARDRYTSRDFSANRFRLVVRSLTEKDAEKAIAPLEEVRRDGLANYFDDQRFGSAGSGEFVARALIVGDFEKALRMALLSPYEHDRADQKQIKTIMQTYWGDWAKCAEQLPPSVARGIAIHLRDSPDHLRGAILALPEELRTLYLNAFQSHLWNRMLAKWLRTRLRPEQLVEIDLRHEKLPMHHLLGAEQRAELAELALPLPTARGSIDPDDPTTALMQAVLAEEGLQRKQLKVPGLREVFFSKGTRAAFCLPARLEHAIGDDELNAGSKKMTLSFELRRGSYATLVVKRIFQNEGW